MTDNSNTSADKDAAAAVKIETLSKCEQNLVHTLLNEPREALRIDLRRADQFRDFALHISWPEIADADQQFNISNWKLSSRISLGQTVVSCTISASIGEPSFNRSTRGICRISCEYGPGLYRYHKAPNDHLVVLSRHLEKAFVHSNALNLDSLCIVKGKLAWNLTCSLVIEHDDGNLFGCASLALLAALEAYSLPDVEVEFTSVTVLDPAKQLPVELSIMHKPLCIQCGLIVNENDRKSPFVLYDQNRIEESLSEGCYTLAMNNLRELCACHMSGQISLTPESSNRFSQKAFEIHKTLLEQLTTKLARLKADHESEMNRKSGLTYKCSAGQLNDHAQEELELSMGEELDSIDHLVAKNAHFAICKSLINTASISPWSVFRKDLKDEPGAIANGANPMPDDYSNEEYSYSE